jgi:phosphoenolpyruvate carboxylase
VKLDFLVEIALGHFDNVRGSSLLCKEGLQLYEMRAILLDNIEQIHADGDMKLDEFYVASIVKYRSIIVLMQDFFIEFLQQLQLAINLTNRLNSKCPLLTKTLCLAGSILLVPVKLTNTICYQLQVASPT